MVTSILTGVTGILDRRFLMNLFFPSLVFWGSLIVIWFLATGNLAEAAKSWNNQETTLLAIEMVGFLAFVTLFSYVLGIRLASILKLYEGYWNFPGGRRLIALCLRLEVPRSDEEIYSDYPLPSERADIMPTQLGNILKNSELYADKRYGLNSVLIWPRLYGLLPERSIALIAEARSTLDFMLVISSMGAVFAIVSGTYLLIVRADWWLFLLCFWGGMIVAQTAYRGAIGSALLFAQQLKAALDLYRNDLLGQTGIPLPTQAPDVVNTLERNVKKKVLVLLAGRFVTLVILLLIGLAGATYLRFKGSSRTGIPFKPEFAVIQINDVYRIDAVENGRIGGLGRVASLVKQARQANPQVAIFHAGDFLSPSLESDYFGGRQMVEAMNYLNGLANMYVVPGNHEFDKKSSLVVGARKESQFTWLSSNIDFRRKGDSPILDESIDENKVVTIGGVKVGIFALTIDEFAKYKSSDGDWPVVASDYTKVAEDEMTKLEGQGADIIVGITHLDVGEDKKIAALRSTHPKFMWIAGGHEHSSQKYDADDGHALITKADSNARSIWRVYFGRSGGKFAVYPEKVNIDESIPVDAEYKTRIEDYYRAELKQRIPQLDEVIGTTNVCLDGREETVRNNESNLGDFVVDQMRSAFPGVPIDAAILGGGTIRIDDRICNEIRVEHLMRTIGFPTPITYIKLSGEEIRKNALEHAITEKNGGGQFLQVSGLRFEFDRRKKEGERVSNIWIRKNDSWNALSETETYTLALSEYILCARGDGYNFTAQATECVGGHLKTAGPDLKHVVADAFSRAYLKGQPIFVPYEMRMLDKTLLESRAP